VVGLAGLARGVEGDLTVDLLVRQELLDRVGVLTLVDGEEHNALALELVHRPDDLRQ